MEYQSFFMILKKYKVENGIFVCDNPLDACGYTQVKKEQNQYFLIVQSGVFDCGANIFVVCNKNVSKTKMTASNLKIKLPFEVDINCLVVLIPELGLFSTLKSTQNCQNALDMLSKKSSKKTILSKIFGKVYDTYFYDCIKPKVVRLFELGKPANEFEIFGQGRWTRVCFGGAEMVVGIIFKDNFAQAIAIGRRANCAKVGKDIYSVAGKLYNILFLSAKDGKFLRFFDGILC